CPFCSAENADEMAACQACGRRLPPLPPRRAGSRNAPPTGINMPPRRAGTTNPPPNANSSQLAVKGDATVVAGPPNMAGPQVPPAPSVDDSWGSISAPTPEQQSLLDAISPGPAAQRREVAPEPRIIGDRRGLNTRPGSPPPPTPPMRPKTSSVPPAIPSITSGPVPSPSGPVPSPSGPVPSPSGPVPTSGPYQRPKPPTAPPPLPVERSRPPTPPPPLPKSGPLVIEDYPRRLDTPTGPEPPPTRIQRSEALVDRPFTPPKVSQVPEIPEPGLVHAARYAYQFAIARWQRRGAIKQLGLEIKQDTEALDQVLGALGRAARGARVEGRVFSAENAAITAAEERVGQLQKENTEVDGRKVEENSKFVDVERERNEKLVEAEKMVEEAQRELQHLEAQRRSLRDRRKELERRQKAYLKNADDADRQAGSAPLGDQRQELRRSAEGHRKEAAALEPDKQEIDRRLASLERPINEATARLDAAKAELDAAKRSLNDAREGHTHRLAELDAEQKRKAREVGLAEAEIQRRLVTLGTLVNLNRIEDPQFAELYQRIDRLRGAITARTTEIEKLTAEREAYDRGTLVRGVATIGGAFVALIALIVILRAVL
ncbi:MAG: hypothetical protein HOV81_45800, partial [Kofleriaceae bacterium]|nr:hypothetical protein [Kofleriaceae bacterium]